METTEDPAKRREKILSRVAGLLAKADSTTFGEERDAFIAKADELMAAYAIEMFEIEFNRNKSERRKPEMRTFEYGNSGNLEADQELVQIFKALADMIGVKVGFWGWRESRVVGYAEDLEYLFMLFTNIRLHMALQLEPKPDSSMTLEDNVAMLKEAGLKWQRIHDMLKKAGIMEDQPWERRIGVRFTKIYTDYCKATGRERMYSSPDVWRRNFIYGYSQGLRTRIREMGRARAKAAEGKEMVLVSMKDELLEALYEFFPHLRPHPPTCDCDTCHYPKCKNLQCKREICVQMRKPVRASRRPRTTVRELKYDASAAAAGSRAAQQADLGSARGAPSGKNKELS